MHFQFKFLHRTNATAEENDAEIINDSIAYLYVTLIVSVIQLVAEFISLSCFNYTAISQVKRLRIKYFTSLMRQEIGWYDLERSKSNFTVRLDEYVHYRSWFMIVHFTKLISFAEILIKLKLELASKLAIL